VIKNVKEVYSGTDLKYKPGVLIKKKFVITFLTKVKIEKSFIFVVFEISKKLIMTVSIA